MDSITDLSPLSPGLIDELEAFMGPVGDNCGYQPEPDTARRISAHQLPDSPPDSSSENPYSPSESHAMPVAQQVLASDYMLVHDHLTVTHEILQNNGYIYEELKSDNLDSDVLRTNINDVVVLPDSGLVDIGLRGVRHDINVDGYQNRYNHMRLEMPELEQGVLSSTLVIDQPMTPVYASLQEPSVKKRKHSQDVSQVKCEPAVQSPDQPRVAPPSVDGSEAGDDTPFQCIRFAPFQQTSWHALFDQNLKPLPSPSYVVGADKGFNYSQIDEAFVCQKKNHFQVTCQMQVQGDPAYVKTADGFKKIDEFFIHFYGVKAEDPNQEVRVEQSQSDRTKKPFHPVPVEIRREGAKVTVGRLHFAETTNNNMRKKGRPNPDQRHFQLAVALKAHCHHAEYMIAAQASDRIIVRASNPGQFESDCSENWWQRGVSENSVHYHGRVGINTDRPDESLVINGNLKVMGHIVHPSDARAKHNIEELDTAQQLRNVQSIRVVKYNYDPSFAEHSGLLGFDPSSATPSTDTGVIAQEVRQVIPEAVKEAGDVTLPNGDTIHKFLVVNKDRIFMENLGAVKELCRVTGNLESRIDQLERINKRLCKISALQRRDSGKSSISNASRESCASQSSRSFYSDGNISIEQIRDIARNIRRHECCHKLSHNSPKYTRKQCRNCRENNTYTKYGKYYNYNKTSTIKYNKNTQCMDYNTLENSEPNVKPELPDENTFSTISKKKDCLWVRNNSVACGNSNVFCCRRKDKEFGDTELISNKLLQIVITVLIFIMAVCLVVMSALYFREHQELLSIKEIRMHDKFSHYASYGKFANFNTPPPHRHTPSGDNLHNQIQNSKPSQHPAAKKSQKEKGSHKTTPEYVSSTTAPEHTTTTTAPLASKNYVKHVLNIESPSPQNPETDRQVILNRGADILGSGCAFDNALNAELDADCQDYVTLAKVYVSSCSLDPPQAYDNQEPLEKYNIIKDLNETTNFARPLEPTPKEKLPTIPVIPERNTSESTKSENDSLKSYHEEINIVAESNSLDPNNNKVINTTENETSKRLRRSVNRTARVRVDRRRRETNEAYLRMSSETAEMVLSEQSEEINGMLDCDKISFGIKSKTFNNASMFEETVCASAFYNVTYTVPVSKCLKEKHIDMHFRSQKLKQLRLCDLQCKYDTSKNCQLNREIAKPIPTEEAWSSKMTLECNMDRELKLRASFSAQKNLCFLTSDQKIPFVEYNIRLYRDCHN